MDDVQVVKATTLCRAHRMALAFVLAEAKRKKAERAKLKGEGPAETPGPVK